MNQARLARRVHFSSAHRYFNPDFSQQQNIEVFGSCYSEHGHGHNYILEAYFSGPINKDTGMVINLQEVDSILKKVTNPLDHHHLNFDVAEFQTKIPTTENIAIYLYDKINQEIKNSGVRLFKVRLYEGDDLWVDVGAEEMDVLS